MEDFKEKAQMKNEMPAAFPIVTAEAHLMWFDDETDEALPENAVVFYIRSLPGKNLKGFKLLKVIGEHEYVLRCSESGWGYYSLDFKTRGHEYARTQLNKEEAEELGKTIQLFISSIKDSEYAHIERINVSPADQSYTVDEIEGCKQEILDTFSEKFDENERLRFYADDKKGYLDTLPPFKIFDLYQELSGIDFARETMNVSMARARTRLFRNYLDNYLPDWQIEETPYSQGSNEFQIIPRTE